MKKTKKSAKERRNLNLMLRRAYARISKAEEVLMLLKLIYLVPVPVKRLNKEVQSGMGDVPSLKTVVDEVLARVFEINGLVGDLKTTIKKHVQIEAAKVRTWRKQLRALEKEAGNEVVEEVVSQISKERGIVKVDPEEVRIAEALTMSHFKDCFIDDLNLGVPGSIYIQVDPPENLYDFLASFSDKKIGEDVVFPTTDLPSACKALSGVIGAAKVKWVPEIWSDPQAGRESDSSQDNHLAKESGDVMKLKTDKTAPIHLYRVNPKLDPVRPTIACTDVKGGGFEFGHRKSTKPEKVTCKFCRDILSREKATEESLALSKLQITPKRREEEHPIESRPLRVSDAEESFQAWTRETSSSRYKWVVDRIHDLPDDFLVFTGGENGRYVSITSNKKVTTLTVGTYQGAVPHIGEALFTPKASKTFEGDNQIDFAHKFLLERAGAQFLIDILVK